MKQYSKISNQQQAVVSHMVLAGSITRREAWVDHNIANLTAVIAKLRIADFHIRMRRRIHPVTLSSYAEYSLDATV
jgi:hypothetical protein